MGYFIYIAGIVSFGTLLNRMPLDIVSRILALIAYTCLSGLALAAVPSKEPSNA